MAKLGKVHIGELLTGGVVVLLTVSAIAYTPKATRSTEAQVHKNTFLAGHPLIGKVVSVDKAITSIVILPECSSCAVKTVPWDKFALPSTLFCLSKNQDRTEIISKLGPSARFFDPQQFPCDCKDIFF